MLKKYGKDSFALLVDEGSEYYRIMHIQTTILYRFRRRIW
jgi:hypothetical protein